ncbi:hypothetical protein [Aneurinibacillus migulanus]|uniref:hypothetical protein n=1 Tax=Aneurinibacillus migulanus TaxID=47500 RepID=UPI001F4192D8|nr:hypothetical protein [Aneurinibacillus migulanus]
MAGGKKRRKDGGRERLEPIRPPFFCRGAGRIHPLLSPFLLLPTTLSRQNIKCNLYNDALVHREQVTPHIFSFLQKAADDCS